MGAVRFSLYPWTELVELHRFLTNATRAVRGDHCPMDTRQFRPHLSIAYANTTVPIMSILPRIEQLRTLPTEASSITSVELVELRREERAYRFDVLDSLQLGG
ncbi:hypothetical protein [Pseudonocardia acaciae]|uniref:hypothetical protein n=1 Tax=Pseudonocardia acaciae TaxID=551276 RepID=UPI0006885DAB